VPAPALHSSTLVASLRELARALSAAWDVDTKAYDLWTEWGSLIDVPIEKG